MLNITLVAPWGAYPPVLQSLTHGVCARRHLHTLAQRLHTFSTGLYVGAITLRGLGGVCHGANGFHGALIASRNCCPILQ